MHVVRHAVRRRKPRGGNSSLPRAKTPQSLGSAHQGGVRKAAWLFNLFNREGLGDQRYLEAGRTHLSHLVLDNFSPGSIATG
jgi:hypothetical protein